MQYRQGSPSCLQVIVTMCFHQLTISPDRETAVMLEMARESRGAIYLTIQEVVSHGEQPVEIVINDEMSKQAGDRLGRIPELTSAKAPLDWHPSQMLREKIKTRMKRTNSRMIPWRVKGTKRAKLTRKPSKETSWSMFLAKRKMVGRMKH